MLVAVGGGGLTGGDGLTGVLDPDPAGDTVGKPTISFTLSGRWVAFFNWINIPSAFFIDSSRCIAMLISLMCYKDTESRR